MCELRVARPARSFQDILNNGPLLFIPPFLCLIRVSRRNRGWVLAIRRLELSERVTGRKKAADGKKERGIERFLTDACKEGESGVSVTRATCYTNNDRLCR